MMREVFIYTDRVVSMVRPRKLLMMAIDGVAPRAKMNQQRSRRFRSAQEAKQKEEDRQNAIAELEAMGKEVSDEYRNEKGWDSNAITPGTPFMDLLAKSLRYWVRKKINEDPGWAGVSGHRSLASLSPVDLADPLCVDAPSSRSSSRTPRSREKASTRSWTLSAGSASRASTTRIRSTSSTASTPI